MPFRSEKQRRYLWSQHPEIAARWSKEYGSKPVAIPPQFMKNKQQNDPKANAKKKAAAARLAKLKSKKKGAVPMVPDTDRDGN